MTSTTLEAFRFHFRRLWRNRHDPYARRCLRQNIKGQRDEKRLLEKERERWSAR